MSMRRVSWGRTIGPAALLAAGLALTACASTRIVDSWKAPGAGPLHFNKVLALAVVQNDSIRRTAEDELQADLVNVKAVQSYKVLGAANPGDLEAVKAILHQNGFDGVVALSVGSAREELSWAPAGQPGGASFSGFYNYSYGSSYMLSDTVVRVEVSVFSLTEDKLLWSGVSESFNPNDTANLVYAIAKAAGAEMRRQGLIK